MNLVSFKIVVLSIQIKTKSMYHNFERNKIHAIGFLKWTNLNNMRENVLFIRRNFNSERNLVKGFGGTSIRRRIAKVARRDLAVIHYICSAVVVGWAANRFPHPACNDDASKSSNISLAPPPKLRITRCNCNTCVKYSEAKKVDLFSQKLD